MAFEGLRYFDIRLWRIAEDVVREIMLGMTYVDADEELTTVSLPRYVMTFNPGRDYLWPIPIRKGNLILI